MRRFTFPLLILSLAFYSCGEEPVEYRTSFTHYNGSGDPVCPISGKNCWLYIRDPLETNSILDNFYTDLAADTLNRFFQNNYWRAIFPMDYPVDSLCVSKMISKEYITFMTADSSIVVSKDPETSNDDNLVVYVLKRND